MTDGCLHRVGPFIDEFGHHIARIIDDIGVVADTADELIRTRAPVQHIVSRQPCDGIGAAQAGQSIIAVRGH